MDSFAQVGSGGSGDDLSRTNGTAAELPVAEYVYTDRNGGPHMRVRRYEARDGSKTFRQDRWTGTAWAPGLNGRARIPYRLPALIAADTSEPIFVVEGEKCVEALVAHGFTATTNPGGAGKWEAGFAAYLAGLDVVVLPDNDEVGHRHAEAVVRSLLKMASSVRVVELPDLPAKGDVVDWFRAGGTADELREIVEYTPTEGEVAEFTDRVQDADGPAAPAVAQLKPFTAASLDGLPVPKRPFLVPGMIPGENVTLFSGDGATGKGLIALQLSVAIAAGRGSWLNREVSERGPVIYLSAEDPKDELHRRVVDIIRPLELGLRDLPDLHLISRAGEDALLAYEVKGGTLLPSPLFQELHNLAAQLRPRLISLDSSADLFPSNEIDRAKVRAFITILRGLALEFGCAVLLQSHPSLTGMASGAGTSGSTAWNNSVRSRLYLERELEEGREADEDVRVLTVKKANHARVGEKIRLRYNNGTFVPVTDAAAASSASPGLAEVTFLHLLDQFTGQGRRLNASGGPNYAPTVFAEHPQNEGVTKRGFTTAMNALFGSGAIVNASEGPPSKPRNFIARATL